MTRGRGNVERDVDGDSKRDSGAELFWMVTSYNKARLWYGVGNRSLQGQRGGGEHYCRVGEEA